MREDGQGMGEIKENKREYNYAIRMVSISSIKYGKNIFLI